MGLLVAAHHDGHVAQPISCPVVCGAVLDMVGSESIDFRHEAPSPGVRTFRARDIIDGD